MKYLILVVIMVMAFGGLAMAENETYDTFSETIRGCNDSCPVLFTPYIAKTFKEVIGKTDARIELNYTGNVNAFTDNNSIGIKAGLEF